MGSRINRVLASGLVLLAVACAENNDAPPARNAISVKAPPMTGPVQEFLEHRRLLGGPDDFGMLVMIEVLNDEYLLVGDAAGNLHLGVVDIGRGTMMARFGSHGEGPREFQGPHRVARDPASDDTWWVYDFPSWTWTPVTMQGDASSWSIGERYSMEGMPPVPETPVWIGENEALVHGMFADFAMARVTFDRNRRVTNWNPVEVPLPFKDLPEPGKRQLNRSFVAVRPSGGFAVAFQYDNEIELRDEHGLLTSRVTGPREVTPDYFFDDEGRFHWGENDDNGYIGAYGTERAFYLLWCGGAECPTMAIHQFDWDGNLVREFGISGVLAFAVSSNDDRMWGFMHENIPPLIGEWDLSN